MREKIEFYLIGILIPLAVGALLAILTRACFGDFFLPGR